MHRLVLTLATVLAAAAVATGCGGEDDKAAAGATGAQGASGVEGSASDISAEQFLAKLLPEKQVAIEGIVATEPECEGVKAEPSFVLVISDAASDADPDTPLTDLVSAEC